jgi:SAM-dependent methyltransferase
MKRGVEVMDDSPEIDVGGFWPYSVGRRLPDTRAMVGTLRGQIVDVSPDQDLSWYGAGAHVIALVPDDDAFGPAVPEGAHASIVVRRGPLDALPVDSGSADVVVSFGALARAQDPVAMLREIVRVLRPGGELRFIEPTLYGPLWFRTYQRLADRLDVWPRLTGFYCGRDVGSLLTAAGLNVGPARVYRIWRLLLAAPVAYGIALRPDPSRRDDA